MIVKIKNSMDIYFLSFLTGTITGIFVILFSKLLTFCEGLFYFNHIPIDKMYSFDFHWLALFIPPTGGLLVGLITHYYCPEAKGNGIDRVLDAFHKENGETRGRVSVFKSLVTIITLSSGGSAGKEGPSAQIGASIGSKISNLFGGGPRARRTLLLAGAAASLGTIFQAPLGGAITAIEMVYREDIESDALMPAIISSVSAYFFLSAFGLVHREVFTLTELAPKYLPLYPLLGVICFFVGMTLVKIIQSVKRFFNDLDVYPPFKPALGGLFCGCIYFIFPVVAGTGETYIEKFLFQPETFTGIPKQELIYFILFIIGFKILTTCFTIGSGGSGGIFGPSLFLGGTIGMLVAEIAGNFYQLDAQHYRSFILVGMGAFYAGVASAPIAAMIMICEMVGSYVLLPPLMFCSIVVFLLSRKLILYPGQVHDRFHSPAHHWDIQTDILRTMPIRQYVKYLHNVATVKITQTIPGVKRLISKRDEKDFIVLDKKGQYLGILSSLQIMKIDPKSKKSLSSYIMDIPAIPITNNLGEALDALLQKKLDKIAVLDEFGQYAGYIRYQEIMELYFTKVRK